MTWWGIKSKSRFTTSLNFTMIFYWNPAESFRLATNNDNLEFKISQRHPGQLSGNLLKTRQHSQPPTCHINCIPQRQIKELKKKQLFEKGKSKSWLSKDLKMTELSFIISPFLAPIKLFLIWLCLLAFGNSVSMFCSQWAPFTDKCAEVLLWAQRRFAQKTGVHQEAL